MSEKTTDEICEKIGEVMGNEIRGSTGWGSLSTVGQKRVAEELKQLVAAIKRDVLRELTQ